ncbi:MAG: hypothetical protein Q9182_003452 [Xanthomendoza sp. 2 TL-2023]
MPSPRDQNVRVFIAGLHWNNEQILRKHWNQAVRDLVNELGRNNTHVSIYESGSWDDSKCALRALDGQLAQLNISRSIILDERTHADEIADGPNPSGWIQTSRGQTELRRIPYLARLRNTVMQPLMELSSQGIRFDKVLFLNDVVFTPPNFYDTFALRDAEGHEAVTSTLPYFRAEASRAAIISGQAVPVKSCWNGIVAFNARPFYHPTSLLFRGLPDSLAQHHLEASECCLIHTDNPLTNTHGVWLNPRVKVGYTATAYQKNPRRRLMVIGRPRNLEEPAAEMVANGWAHV